MNPNTVGINKKVKMVKIESENGLAPSMTNIRISNEEIVRKNQIFKMNPGLDSSTDKLYNTYHNTNVPTKRNDNVESKMDFV